MAGAVLRVQRWDNVLDCGVGGVSRSRIVCSGGDHRNKVVHGSESVLNKSSTTPFRLFMHMLNDPAGHVYLTD